MVEDGRQIPLEEQVRLDSRFSTLLDLVPDFSDSIASLLERDMSPRIGSSKMWVSYLTKYNTLIREIRVGDDENLPDGQKAQTEAVGSLLGKVKNAIRATNENYSLFLLSGMLANGFDALPDDELDMYLDLFLDTPDILIAASKAKLDDL